MTDMESGTYDVILEKGTIDALMVNQPDPWTVSEEMAETIDRVLSHVSILYLKKNLKIIFFRFVFQKYLFCMLKSHYGIVEVCAMNALHNANSPLGSNLSLFAL